MRLERLDLEEFRSYRQAKLPIPSAGLRVYGANASGKTSLLEAIYLLATTRSPRATIDRDLINWASNDEFALAPYARIVGQIIQAEGEQHVVELTLEADGARPNISRKRAKLDGRACRLTGIVGTLKVVLFSPEDLNLVLGSPSGRRRYLDISISQLDRTYLRALSRYSKLVERRNSLLKDLGSQSGRNAEDELAYWDDEFITYSSYILAARLRYLQGLNHEAGLAYQRLSGGDGRLKLEYTGSVNLPAAQVERVIVDAMPTAQSILSRAVGTQLRQRRHDELRRGLTLLGPHRDDFLYELDGRSLASFGSRGQQRLAIVATKLAELQQIVAISGETPVLLLDDVLSELDPAHQDGLLDTLGKTGCQIILTATSRGLLDHRALSDLPLGNVQSGTIVLDAR